MVRSLYSVSGCESIQGWGDPHERDTVGRTLLHRAASNNDASVTHALLAAGADPNAPNNNGETPVQWAVRYSENVAAIQALTSAAADPNATLSESSSRKGSAAPPTATE